MAIGFDPVKRARAVARMKRLPEAVKRNARAQQAANAAELVAAQRRVVAVDEGALRGTIKHQDESDEGRIRQKVSAGGPETTHEVRSGSGKSFDHARAVEFGTNDTRAQPFFWPSYRALRKPMKAKMNRAAKAGIKEALS